MVLQATPAYARVLSHPEITLRNVHRAMFGGRSGACRRGDFAIAPTGTTRQFSIAAGRAYIHGQENSSQGGYIAWSDASENQVVGAPSASPRIDTILLQIYDEQYGTLPSGTSRAEWRIVAGTPGASPIALPDSSFLTGGANYVPGAWWRVADIRSNPGDTTIPAGQIYSPNSYVRVPGGITLVSSAVSTSGFGGRPTDPVDGETIYEIDTRRTFRYNSTSGLWEPPYVEMLDAYRITAADPFQAAFAFGSETAIGKMTHTVSSIRNGELLRFSGQMAYLTLTDSEHVLILRKDTAVSGAVVGTAQLGRPPDTNGHPATWEILYPVAADASNVNFYYSVLRTLGTGQLSLYGQANSKQMAYGLVETLGPSTKYRNVT